MKEQKKQQLAESKPRLVEIFADRYSVDPVKMIPILRATAFSVKRGDPPVTDEEMGALLVVANEYRLNPFTREIYAFRNKSGGITPIVGIDGWIRIVERQPTYRGEEMKKGYDDEPGPDGKELGFWYECLMLRSDRDKPISRRQYYKENYRNTDPWNQMPTRMLQHRAYIQSARAAFGFGGIFDPDEGEVIALGSGVDLLPMTRGKPTTQAPEAKKEPVIEHIGADSLELMLERLAKSGIPDAVIYERFKVSEFNEIKTDQLQEVLQFIEDNSP